MNKLVIITGNSTSFLMDKIPSRIFFIMINTLFSDCLILILFKVKNNILADIPQINSNTQDYKKMYDLYLDLSKMLEKIDLKIYSISHDKDMLNITTNKYDFLVRYSRYYIKIDEFIHVYEQFRNQYKKNIKTIDLRYPTGFAVH